MNEISELEDSFIEKIAVRVSQNLKKGRLMDIVLHGKDGDSVRAIKELNAMEIREQERGGGEESPFEEMVMSCAAGGENLGPHPSRPTPPGCMN